MYLSRLYVLWMAKNSAPSFMELTVYEMPDPSGRNEENI